MGVCASACCPQPTPVIMELTELPGPKGKLSAMSLFLLKQALKEGQLSLEELKDIARTLLPVACKEQNLEALVYVMQHYPGVVEQQIEKDRLQNE